MKVDAKQCYLTPEEMAARLRISLRKLYLMMKQGTAPEHIRLGHKLLFVIGGAFPNHKGRGDD